MNTDNERLDTHIRSSYESVSGSAGKWNVDLHGFRLFVLTDERADRMRIMTAVARLDPEDDQLASTLLHANFDRALDARYALWREHVWSVFLHPLSSITPKDFDEAVAQVCTLARNFGSTFSSTEMVFVGGAETEH